MRSLSGSAFQSACFFALRELQERLGRPGVDGVGVLERQVVDRVLQDVDAGDPDLLRGAGAPAMTMGPSERVPLALVGGEHGHDLSAVAVRRLEVRARSGEDGEDPALANRLGEALRVGRALLHPRGRLLALGGRLLLPLRLVVGGPEANDVLDLPGGEELGRTDGELSGGVGEDRLSLDHRRRLASAGADGDSEKKQRQRGRRAPGESHRGLLFPRCYVVSESTAKSFSRSGHRSSASRPDRLPCESPLRMSKHDVVVVGGGISGLTFAFEAARAGRSVLVLERAEKPGGCLSTHRTAGGYWFELGAHTCYNSYVGFTELIEGCGLRGEVLQRAKTHLRFLDGDRLVPGSNLGVLLRLFSWPEAAISLPRMLGAKKDGKTVEEFYGRHRREAELREGPGPDALGGPLAERRRVPGRDALQDARHAPEGLPAQLHASRGAAVRDRRARPAAGRRGGDGHGRR